MGERERIQAELDYAKSKLEDHQREVNEWEEVIIGLKQELEEVDES